MKPWMGLYQKLQSRFEDRRIAPVIRRSGLFDAAYYLSTNPDVASAGIDPFYHYVHRGRREGRAPSAYFDPKSYSEANSDVARSGLDPVLHFIKYGRSNTRPGRPSEQLISDSGLFDQDYYRTAYMDVVPEACNLFEHYINQGVRKNYRPSLDFDPEFYLANNPDLQRSGTEPVVHYILSGMHEGRLGHGNGPGSRELPDVITQLRSSGLFDESFYLRQCPAVRVLKLDPFFHYLVAGASRYLETSPAFSLLEYSLTHKEAVSSGAIPLLHLLDSNSFENGNWAAPLNDAKAWLCSEGKSKPDQAISLERMAGEAYLYRFSFSSDSTDCVGTYTADAVRDMARRCPRLKRERLNPDASIIIPVYGQLHFVLNCLDSLSRQRSRFSAEIIVLDDASPDASETLRLEAIPWIRYQRRDANSGFIDTCNDAARIAKGRFLVFLNSDTRVAEGWLDELLGSFELFPKAGLVGSKLFNPDGSLQDAGGIYWRDGSAWNYGRNDDPNHPKYCFSRQVDYASGASIAVPAEIWRRLDGFDEMYRPAYCEDADLAFRMRTAGYEVWLQPLSCVLHYEGKTHGTDLYKGVKAYQRRNTRLFARRWKTELAEHRPNGDKPDLEANRFARDRVLVLDALTPMPDRDSGSFITFKMLEALRVLGYDVTFVPQHCYLYDGSYTSALQRLGMECLYSPHFNKIEDVLDYRRDFDVVLGYRFNVLEQAYKQIRQRVPAARVMLHNVDLHFLRLEREAVLRGGRCRKIAAAITQRDELELIAKVDCTIVHTKAEIEVIKRHLPIDNIVEFPYIADRHSTRVGFEERHDVMFLGGFNHPPNRDAVKYFVQSIWPLLEDSLPGHARVLIVGGGVPAEIQALSRPRIRVIGHVKDLQSCFDQARVFVAPLRYGAGIKGKVIQSLAHGVPSVITSVAAEGIGLVSGRETFIADDDNEFAKQVILTYIDRNRWQTLQAAGYRFVDENYSWQRCLDLCTKALDTADSTWLVRHNHAMRRRLNTLTKCSHSNQDTLPLSQARARTASP